MKIAIIGTGFVGLTHAAVTAMYGHDVIGYDTNPEKIAAYNSGDKSFIEKFVSESGLADIVKEQLCAKRLSFSCDPYDIADCEIFFMCLPTPYKMDGKSDLTYFFSAADTISEVLLQRKEQRFVLFVDKSTVPVGTAKRLNSYLATKGLADYDVASNPEFLPEGDAVNSAIHSHKVVVGANKKESFDLLRRVYPHFANSSGYVETNPETAEAIKYASNGLLFSQLVAWQSIPGKLGEAFPEVDFDIMKKGILADKRIAGWGSYISAGAGGSCFKKDALSLGRQLSDMGVDSSYIELVNRINEHHKYYLIERAEHEARYDFNMKKVAILGTAFKQGTNDMRESNVLEMIPRLLMRGVEEIRIYDPVALDEAKKYFNPSRNQNFKRITYHDTVQEALKDTDATFIATDHQEFRSLSDSFIQYTANPHLVIDGRRIMPSFDVERLLSNGKSYLSIGGTFRKASKNEPSKDAMAVTPIFH